MAKIEIVKNFIKVYNSLNVESMLTYQHPDIEFKNTSGGIVNARTKGVEEFKELVKSSIKFIKERNQTITSSSETDDTVNVEISSRGVLAEDLPNGLKAGEILTVNGKSKYLFKDNLIILLLDES